MGEGLGAFLAHPAFQDLGAYLEVPGADRDGRRAPTELEKVRELHARWTSLSLTRRQTRVRLRV